MRKEFEEGIAWGDSKRRLFELLNAHLSEARERYESYLQDGDSLESVLQEGASKARSFATPFIATLREAVGIRKL